MSTSANRVQLPDWITDHIRRYVDSDGADGHMWDSTPAGGKGLVATLLLTTVGRKTGEPLTIPLIYGTAGNGYVVCASKGGAPQHPAWYLNLLENSVVQIQVGAKRSTVRGRTASGPEREKLWTEMIEIFPPYAAYQEATSRELPLVILEPEIRS